MATRAIEKGMPIEQVQKILAHEQIDTTTAIRMFLTQALAVNGFPFEIKKISANPYGALSEDEILKKLEKAREHAEQGMYKDAYDVSRDMRAKYGL